MGPDWEDLLLLLLLLLLVSETGWVSRWRVGGGQGPAPSLPWGARGAGDRRGGGQSLMHAKALTFQLVFFSSQKKKEINQ